MPVLELTAPQNAWVMRGHMAHLETSLVPTSSLSTVDRRFGHLDLSLIEASLEWRIVGGMRTRAQEIR
jgi:hypothetical protein